MKATDEPFPLAMFTSHSSETANPRPAPSSRRIKLLLLLMVPTLWLLLLVFAAEEENEEEEDVDGDTALSTSVIVSGYATQSIVYHEKEREEVSIADSLEVEASALFKRCKIWAAACDRRPRKCFELFSKSLPLLEEAQISMLLPPVAAACANGATNSEYAEL
jgi:hypothetical protein